MLTDIHEVASRLGVSELPCRLYRIHGKFSASNIKERFGRWNNATALAGLTRAGERDIPLEELFDNLREVWTKLGRQPRKRKMHPPNSRWTHHPYYRRFGSWLAAIKAFLATLDVLPIEGVEQQPRASSRGPRDPSLRLRFLVMRRDNFKCRHCGASPATAANVELQIDHIQAWSKGGPTLVENLQTLCTNCNLGKSDLPQSSDGGVSN